MGVGLWGLWFEMQGLVILYTRAWRRVCLGFKGTCFGKYFLGNIFKGRHIGLKRLEFTV
jgi:hypothetical protein